MTRGLSQLAAFIMSLILCAIHSTGMTSHRLTALQGWQAASSPHQEWALELDQQLHLLGLDPYLHPPWLSHPQPQDGSPERQQDLRSSSRHLHARHT